MESIGHNNPPSDFEIVKSRLEEGERDIKKAILEIEKTPLPESVDNEEIAGIVTDRIKSIRNIGSGITKTYKEIKEPYLQCSRAVDAWKNKLEADLAVMKSSAEKVLSIFLTKKAEEERLRQLEIARKQREEAEKLAQEALAHSQANLQETANELLGEAIKSESVANRIENTIADAKSHELVKTRSAFGSTASQKTAWVGKIVSLRGIDLEVLRPYLSEDVIQKALNSFVRNGGRECSGAEIKEEITGLNIR